MSEYTNHDYYNDFLSSSAKRKAALERALDTRKFEIELYWKRAAYFWTFIGATLAGYIAIKIASMQTTLVHVGKVKILEVSATDDVSNFLSVLLACLGLVFSVSWYLVNRGSKYWQENWEYHVDLLEDDVSGPIYKTVLLNDKNKILIGPAWYSVSKINISLSLYVSVVWVTLLLHSLANASFFSKFKDLFGDGNVELVPYIFLVFLSVVTLVFMYFSRTEPPRSEKDNINIKAMVRVTKLPCNN
ncbi:hypothetical protein [Pseudovibrio sp. POLY-S9]|uniref:RipA family octameric membrane protein n=1 Tax=Pseudovibrio sp. POLY-S9 TaxID=1576596 RepID=UPI00128EBEF2|nr:hypothetical protein [Pseudovibrio sp. POLY-S9]